VTPHFWYIIHKKGYNDKKRRRKRAMKKFVCPCGYVYDPEKGDPDNGVAPGTAWEDVPEDWVCPVCGLGKLEFLKEEAEW